jgi:TonB family protein
MRMFYRNVAAAVALAAALGCASAAPQDTPEDFQPAFDTAPVIEKAFEPDYPKYAKQNNMEGTVMVRVTLSDRGKIEDARVVESSNNVFDEPALTAVRQFRFKPAYNRGEPVRSTVMVPVHFRL